MKSTMKKWLALALALAMLMSLAACGGKNDPPADDQSQQQGENQPGADDQQPDDAQQPTEENYDGKLELEGPMEIEYAKNFTIDLYKGGYRMIHAGTGGYDYLVVPEGMSVPEGLDENVVVLQMPITNLYMASTSMVSLIDAIGALDRVKLVGTDVGGWYLDNVVKEMEAGNIKFSGKYSEPDFEIIASSDIQLHVDTTMIDSKPEILEKFVELGIPSLVEDSSKESTPLGRVEWVKIFGVLFGMEEEAKEYFEEQKAMVDSATAPESYGKTVGMGYLSSTSDKCYARNGGDYYAQMIGLAGGDYILADMEPDKSGNSNMTFEEWYAKFKDADCLFYMNFAAKFYSIEEMIEFNPLFADFKAVQNGNVWVTSADFTQSTAAIASIIVDMNTILSSENPSEVTTDHLIKIS